MLLKPPMRPFFGIKNYDRADITIQILDLAMCPTDVMVSEFDLARHMPLNPKIAQVIQENYPVWPMLHGSIVTTVAFTLPAKHLIHVAPMLTFDTLNVVSLYARILQKAESLQPQTIAFPVIQEIQDNLLRATQAAAALDTLYHNLRNIRSLNRLLICVPDERSLAAYLEAARYLAPSRIVAA
jgi:O-acetyl-ADP-ribose deacetylase (regulator of RNase III)